jgi:hypothetical protein
VETGRPAPASVLEGDETMSLYGRLFTYRERKDKSPFEDYLTEALVDLLNRFPANGEEVFCEFFLSDCPKDDRERWRKEVAKLEGKFRWKTQVSIESECQDKPNRRPDIVCSKGEGGEDNPIAVIECKVGADFQERQLEDYGGWLAKKTDWAALVVLTHLTQTPEGFLEKDQGQKYGVRLCAVKTWSELYKWLAKEKEGRKLPNDSSPPDILVDEFLSFLKEVELSTDEPTALDFAAARVCFQGGAYSRIVEAMQKVRVRAKTVLPGRTGEANSCPGFEVEPSDVMIWDGGSHKQHDIRWGIWFGSPESEWWNKDSMLEHLSHRDGMCIYINPPVEQGSYEKLQREFPSWYFPHESGRYRTIVKTDPLPCEEEFTEAFWRWLEPSLEEAKQIVEQLEQCRKGKSA